MPGGLGCGSACKPRSVHRRRPVYGLAAFIPAAGGWAIISLGRRVTAWLVRPTRGSEGTSRPLDPEGPLPLLGLAPGEGCLAAAIAGRAGGLLHHLFTLTPALAGAVCFCGPVRGSPRPGITRRRALWSADFPQPAEPAAIARPTHTRFHLTPTSELDFNATSEVPPGLPTSDSVNLHQTHAAHNGRGGRPSRRSVVGVSRLV